MGTTACPCGRSRRRAIAPPVESTDGHATVRLEGVGVLVCDADHVEVVDAALADHLSVQLGRQVLVAERRGWRRRDACGHCREFLTMRPRSTETPVVDDAGPTVVTLTPVAPMVRCSSCGREQYVREVFDRLADLTRRAVGEVARPDG